jgi:spore maturation protein CgeB
MSRGRIVILGLTITSSWGNGHATTYRALVRELARRGHDVLFLERNVPWYADNRDLPCPPYGVTRLYHSVEELTDRFSAAISSADVVMIGSYVADGAEIGQWVTQEATGITAFYDIDTPVTVANLGRGHRTYLTPELVPRYDLYLSFTAGPILEQLTMTFGARCARPLHCSADVDLYRPEATATEWDLGYLGTYSADRQPTLDALLCEPAREWSSGRFIVAGPQYPDTYRWPPNVERVAHVPPGEHPAFYARQRFTLNVTREAMVRSGWSPSVRLFEAAACGTPIISDIWPGLEDFFMPDREILLARNGAETLEFVRHVSDARRECLGRAARARVLGSHTPDHRAAQLEAYVAAAQAAKRRLTIGKGAHRG